MSDFWPAGLVLTDTQTPRQILEEAQGDWETNSDGQMTLVLQRTRTESGNDRIIVHAKHRPANRTAALFSIVYRPRNPYPVTIQLKNEDLPDFLKKAVHEPGMGGVGVGVVEAIGTVAGRTVTNQWVSDTPVEFREKLIEVFNLGIVKSEVLNLMCAVTPADVDSPDGLSDSDDD